MTKLVRKCQKASGGPLNSFKHGQKYKDSKECAYFVNHLLNNNGYMMSGNAWTPRGASIVFNGFSGLEKPEKYDEDSYNTYAKKAIDNVYKNFITRDSLDLDKIYTVNMYYSTSPHKKQAFDEGKEVSGTHTGYLSYEPSDDKWYVTHNIHGTIHKEPFGQLLNSKGNYGVTAIYEPRKNTIFNRAITKLGFKSGGTINI